MKHLFSIFLLVLVLTGCSTLEPVVQAGEGTASEASEKVEQQGGPWRSYTKEAGFPWNYITNMTFTKKAFGFVLSMFFGTRFIRLVGFDGVNE